MIRFLIRRILLGVLVMWMVTVLVWVMFFASGGPQDVAQRIAGKEATPADIASVMKEYGLDRPKWDQYWDFLVRLVWHHDLGRDYLHHVPVTTIIAQAFPITFWLAVGAAVIWLVMGVLTGVISAVRRGSIIDRTFTTLALVFYSFPTFVLGLLILYLFFFQFTIHGIKVFPGAFPTSFPSGIKNFFEDYTLPWITLALVSAATYTRLTRSSLLEVLGEDYIRTARSKGLLERRVIYRHGLRSALTPVASQFGIDVGTLLGGAVITEQVFGMPGLGRTAVASIEGQNMPVIIGIVIFAAAAVIIANIVVDVFYAVLDPRVRLH